MKTISDRLNFLRGYLKLSQPEVATRFGIPYNSYIKYEHGSSKPGSDAMEGIARAGINTNWLLTGDGPIHLSELLSEQPQAAPAGAVASPAALDPARLREAIILTEHAAAVQPLSPEQRADMILSFYQHLSK